MGNWGNPSRMARAAASRSKKNTSGVKIGTAIKITRTKKGTRTTVRGGSAQMRKNEKEQRGGRN